MIQCEFNSGRGTLLVTAIHAGHQIRSPLLPYFALTEGERLREEDPYTGTLTNISSQSVIVKTSRFETDINRPPEKAIYINPEDAWGLGLYHQSLPEHIIETSQDNYYNFYDRLKSYVESILEREEWLIIYDLHSYNHRREGTDRYALPDENPEVNIGTGNTHASWQPVIKQLMVSMREFNFQGRYLDVRENVKFQGGYFSKWLNEHFGDRVCPIAIEFKKFFMDEWTGEVDRSQLNALRQMLIDTIRPVMAKAEYIKRS